VKTDVDAGRECFIKVAYPVGSEEQDARVVFQDAQEN